MRAYRVILVILLSPYLASAWPETQWNGKGERQELMQRIQRFYANPQDASAMNHRQPKYDVLTNQQVDPHPFLKSKEALPKYSLSWLAQGKGTPEFQAPYQWMLQQKFPEIRKQNWAALEANDRVEELTKTWMQPSYDLDRIPTSGRTSMSLWSDDYWPMKYGITSYRYGDYPNSRPPYKTYQQAIAAYSQPSQWLGWLSFGLPKVTTQLLGLSPAEKYDLTVGDEAFTLTNEQKKEGSQNLGKDGDVESWMGICHGWTAASVMVPKPVQPVSVVGAHGVNLTWYPADIRAISSLAWANGDFTNHSVGGRCSSKHPETFANGRLMDQDCFDSNPSTFHLALGNLVGRGHLSFIMDKAFDYQVWNQPIYSYEFTYFNPLNPKIMSKNWRQVAVPYDYTFKRYDRFQYPLTRGVRTKRGYSDRHVRYVVGVVATVTYVVESFPLHQPKAGSDLITRENYTYDLELYEYNGHYLPQGGEWHENAHPDFLWLPARGTQLTLDADKLPGDFGVGAPSAALSAAARAGSQAAYPLCRVVKGLVDASSGGSNYRCQ